MKWKTLLIFFLSLVMLIIVSAASETLGSPVSMPNIRVAEGITAVTGTVFEVTGSDYIAAINQVEAFINKVQQDLSQWFITQEEANRYLAMANEII